MKFSSLQLGKIDLRQGLSGRRRLFFATFHIALFWCKLIVQVGGHVEKSAPHKSTGDIKKTALVRFNRKTRTVASKRQASAVR